MPLDDVGQDTGSAENQTDNDAAEFKHIDLDGDHDWFQVSLVAGKEYLFNVRGVDTGHGDVADPKLALRDASGNLVTIPAGNYADNLTGINHDAQIIYVAPSSGTYYVDAYAAAGNTGVYTLGIGEKTELPGVTNDLNDSMLGMFDAQVSILGTPTDKDVFKVHLEAGTTYALDMLGAGDRGSVPDAYLTLYGTNGITVLATDNDSGFDKDARIIYTPSVTGDYFLEAKSNDGNVGYYWMYTAQLTGQNYMDSLLAQWNETWGPDNPGDPYTDWHWTLTYSFMASAPTYAYAADKVGFQMLDSSHQDAVRAALTAWGSLANITFVESVDSPDVKLRFGANTGGADGNAVAAYAYYPSPALNDSIGGDLYFNVNDSSFNAITPGQYGYSTILHEIGHALGLKHPGDYNAGDSVSGGMGPFLPLEDDSRMHTVMSYNADSLSGGVEPMTPMLYDVDAIQWLYGANMTLHGGNDTYDFNEGDHLLEAIWDPGGKDTFDASGMTSQVTIDLVEFHMSSIGGTQNIGIVNGSVIENAKGGSASDQIIGNAAKNVLTGNGGADTLTGGGGTDTLNGGLGNDSLDGGGGIDSMNGAGGNDTYTVTAGDLINDSAGTDTIKSAITWSLVGNAAIENLTLTGSAAVNATGNDLANVLTGNSAANVLTGGVGPDVLSGGPGADLLRGNGGNDTFVWDAADAVVAGATQGGPDTDTLRLDGGGKTLNLTSIRNDAVTSVEVIDITGSGNNTLKIAAGDILGMNAGHEVTVKANAGDHAVLSGTWTYEGQELGLGGVLYDHYLNGSASLLWAVTGEDIVL